MTIEIDFTPQRLHSLVAELKRSIGTATGEPNRLDIQDAFVRLRQYQENPARDNLPTLATLEKLSLRIPMIKEEGLYDAFFDCLQHRTNETITSAILDYYFNNYSDLPSKNYLLNNIHKAALDRPGWETWSRSREVFFKGEVVENIASFVIQQHIQLQHIPERLGMPEPFAIRQDAISCLCNNDHYFTSYLSVLHLESILSILDDDTWQRSHTPLWNYTLPKFRQEAIKQRNQNDTDHPLFAKAKLHLRPITSPQWLRLNNDAKEAYQEWALGARLEAFFDQDTDNKRILFWKRYLRFIARIKEVEYQGSIGAFAILIGKYEFVEFRDIGAIYVYEKDAIKIPSRVTSLESLKHRHKVIHGRRPPHVGGGWQPHLGNVWQERVNRLIKEALR